MHVLCRAETALSMSQRLMLQLFGPTQRVHSAQQLCRALLKCSAERVGCGCRGPAMAGAIAQHEVLAGEGLERANTQNGAGQALPPPPPLRPPTEQQLALAAAEQRAAKSAKKAAKQARCGTLHGMITSLPSDRHVTGHRPCMRLSGPSLTQAKKLAKSIAKAEKKEKNKKGRKQHRRSSSSEDAAAPTAPTSGDHAEDFSKGSPARVAQRNDWSGAGDRQREGESHHRRAVDNRARRPDRGDPADDKDRRRERDDGRSSRRRDASPSQYGSDGRRRRSRSPTRDRQHRH